MEVDICEPQKHSCVDQVDFPDADSGCLKSCEGLYVTSYFKTPIDEESLSRITDTFKNEYRIYKDQAYVASPDDLEGNKLNI